MKIGLFINESSCLSKETCCKFKNILKEHGVDFIDVNLSCKEKCDYLVVFGGDGTVVKCVPYAVRYDVPVVVINTGTFGFLSDFTPEQLTDVFSELTSNPCYTEKTLLKVEHNGKSKLCLNDVVIQRKPKDELVSEVIKLEISLNNEKIDNFFADGVIISTPTGSTAYSLSAGGAILIPDVSAFIITPVCSHSFLSRPIVYDDKSVLKIKSIDKDRSSAVYGDGRYFSDVDDNEIIISKSSQTFKLIKFKKEFFYKLSRKFNRVISNEKS